MSAPSSGAARRGVVPCLFASLIFCSSWLLGAADAAAGEPWPAPAPRYRLLMQSTLGGSYNSEGAEEQVRLGAQMLLFRSESAALRDNFVFVGVSPRINPVGLRVGPSIEIQPLTVFNVRFNLEFCDYFGSFSSLQSFASPLAGFSAAERERGAERGGSYATTGARLSVSPAFQAKIGPLVVRDRLTYEYFAMNVRDGDTTYYEPALDTLAPARGTVVSNDLDVFYVLDLPAGGLFSHGRLAAGARYTLFEPMFTRTSAAESLRDLVVLAGRPKAEEAEGRRPVSRRRDTERRGRVTARRSGWARFP